MIAGSDEVRAELDRILSDLGVYNLDVQLETPRDPSHGDLATNVALQLAGRLKRKPRDIAEDIAGRIALPETLVRSVEVAGPGFINFRLGTSALGSVLENIIAAGSEYGRSKFGAGKKINVEFVSANPTGPLHVGHGRGAAVGDAVAALLEATGHEVTREFYVNDAGLQIERLARSLWARVRQEAGKEAVIPQGGYQGEYLVALARRVLEEKGPQFAELAEDEAISICRDIAVADQRREQDRDLADFGVRFDVVFSESNLYEQNEIEETLDDLRAAGHIYEKDGAVWLAAEKLGDEKDRVLKKRDGSYTYFMPDIAYHLDKFKRGFDQAIDILGSDHHGYVPRVRAALKALSCPDDFFDVSLVQMVKIMRGGEEIRFSKRSGDFVTLRDLYEETGVDAARYFFLMRRADSQFVFDIDLATSQSDENPVYYVQYAHTRMRGIFRKGEIEPDEIVVADADLSQLREKDENDLIRHLGEFPSRVERAAVSHEPHRIITYLDELATLVNGWYHRHRVMGAGTPELERARLVLVRAAQLVLKNGLELIGVTAPERM